MSRERATAEEERAIAAMLGRLLRAGVVAATSVVALGGAVFLLRHGGEPARHGEFVQPAEHAASIATIVRGVLAWRGRAIIQLGLLLLIGTPVARVAFSLGAFLHERDALYVVITAIVLAALVLGLAGVIA